MTKDLYYRLYQIEGSIGKLATLTVQKSAFQVSLFFDTLCLRVEKSGL